jgi:hypothetical protein
MASMGALAFDEFGRPFIISKDKFAMAFQR